MEVVFGFTSQNYGSVGTLLSTKNAGVKGNQITQPRLNHHPNEALIFKDLEIVWNELKTIYSIDFKNLVYGKLPDETAILETLKMIQDNIKYFALRYHSFILSICSLAGINNRHFVANLSPFCRGSRFALPALKCFLQLMANGCSSPNISDMR